MARTKPPPPLPGRPVMSEGLGATPTSFPMADAQREIADGENPTPERENPPLEGTNRQPTEVPPLDIEGLMTLPVLMKEEKNKLDHLWSEFLDQNAVIEQNATQLRTLEQQVAQGMSLLEQCKNAIITLEQRQNALAQQQLQSNLRVTAAQLAIQAKASHDGGDKLVEQAEHWHRFLLRDLVVKITPPSPPEEIHIPDGLDPTQH